MPETTTPAKETTAAAPVTGTPAAPATTEPKTAATPAAPATGETKGSTEPAKGEEGKPASFMEGSKTDPEKKPGDEPKSGDAPTFKLPEGVKADEPLAVAFSTTVKDLGLSADQAQKLVDSYAGVIAAQNKAATEAWAQRERNNVKALEAHPYIGGAKLTESMQWTTKAWTHLNQEHKGLGERVKTKLIEAGLGNDPDLAHFVTLAGQSMPEDRTGSIAKTPGQATNEERLQKRYPSLKITGG